MFPGYRKLSSDERLILVQLPNGTPDSHPEWKSESEIRISAGMSAENFQYVVKVLEGKGLVERARIELPKFSSGIPRRIFYQKMRAICRSGKATKKFKSIPLT